MAAEVAHGAYEYRTQGGEIHRRPADRDGLTPWEAAWVVVNDRKRDVPPVVINNLRPAGNSMRFD